MKHQRIRNVASVHSVANCLRANLLGVDKQHYLAPFEHICAEYGTTMMAIMNLTPRPNKGILVPAVQSAFEVDLAEATAFSSALLNCIALCRVKAKSATSGIKLHRAVRVMVNYLNSTQVLRTRLSPLTKSLKKKF
jgi:hypothetical protein